MKKVIISLFLSILCCCVAFCIENCNFEENLSKADAYFDKIHSKEEMYTPQGKEIVRQGLIYYLKAMKCDNNRIYKEYGAPSNIATAFYVLGQYDECVKFSTQAINKVTNEREKTALQLMSKLAKISR